MASSGASSGEETQLVSTAYPNNWAGMATSSGSTSRGPDMSNVGQGVDAGNSQGASALVGRSPSVVGGSHGVAGDEDVVKLTQQTGSLASVPATAFQAITPTKNKSRTSCNLCTGRKKRCDYVEIGGKKQQCTLCRKHNLECVFGERPPRKPSTTSNQGASKGKILPFKRPRIKASAATGLVGMEENYYVADFFDRLGFFPMANERSVQRAIMDLLFQPAEDAIASGRRRNLHGLDRRGEGGTEKRRLTGNREMGEFGLLAKSVGGGSYDDEEVDNALTGPLALRRKWYKHEDSRPFSCMLWCTIALGAMTSNMCSRLVHSYVKFAEEAIDGVLTPDVPTAKAYTIISMVYAWLDNCNLFKKHLDTAVGLVEIMHNNGEEVPLEVLDMIKEQQRVHALHYSRDSELISQCANEIDDEPDEVNPLLMMRDSGLFHMVRFYTDGVFKAFWRDALSKDPMLPQTKEFADKHREQCEMIEKFAQTDERLKDSAGGLYIRAAMQFVRLPLDTDPMESLKSAIEMTRVITKVPGVIRFGPVKHYVHCLLMGLARPAMVGIDQGSYETLRTLYNSLDVSGPEVAPAHEMEIASLCDFRFCRCMAWAHQQKVIRRSKAQAAAANGVPSSPPSAPMGNPDPPGYVSPARSDAVGGNDQAASFHPSPQSRPLAEHQAPQAQGSIWADPRMQQDVSAGSSPVGVRGGSPSNATPAPAPFSPSHPSPGSSPLFVEGVSSSPAPSTFQNAEAQPVFAMKQDPSTGWGGSSQGFGSVRSRHGIVNVPAEPLLAAPPLNKNGSALAFSTGASSVAPMSSPVRHQQQPVRNPAVVNLAPVNSWDVSTSAPGVIPNAGSAPQSSAVPMDVTYQRSGISGGSSSIGGVLRGNGMSLPGSGLPEPPVVGNNPDLLGPARQPDAFPEEFARGHERMLQNEERADSAQGLHHLLFSTELDDPDLPEVYQGDSDAEELAAFMRPPMVRGSPDDDSASLRSLEAILGTKT